MGMMIFAKTVLQKYCTVYAGLPRAVWYGIAIGFLNAIQNNLFFFLSTYLVRTLHISIDRAGYTLSCYALGTLLGSILGGKLSDHFSARTVSIIAPLVVGFVYGILGFLRIPWEIDLAAFCMGLAGYAFLTANSAEVLSHCPYPQMRVQALSLLAVVANLGFSCSGVLVGVFEHYGFPVIFMSVGAFSLIVNFCRIFQHPLMPSSREERPATSPQPQTNTKPYYGKYLLIIALGVVFLVNLIYAQVSSTYPIYITQHFSLKAFTFLMVLNALFIVFFSVPINHYFKKKNKMVMLGIGGFLFGCGMLMLVIFTQSLTWTFFALWIFTVGEIVFLAMAQEICYATSHASKKGLGLGLYRGTTAVSRMVGPTLGTGIYHNFGAWFVWVFCGVIGLVSFIIGWLCKKHAT